MSAPFFLRMSLACGDSQLIAEKFKWIGKALLFPLSLLPQVKARPEPAPPERFFS